MADARGWQTEVVTTEGDRRRGRGAGVEATAQSERRPPVPDAATSAEELRASEERFHMLAELFDSGVLVVSREGRHLYSNRAWRDIVGLVDPERLDALDNAWLDIVHPDDRQVLERNLMERIARQSSLRQSFRFVRADDGRVREGRGTIHPLHDAEGRLAGAIASLQDVTQELETEQEHQRLLQILEETSDCVMLISRDVGILQANAAARRTFGEHIVGKSADRIMTAETRRRVWTEGLPAVDRGHAWREDVELVGADGRTLPMSALLQPHRNTLGHVAYLSATLRDISEQKSAEIELARQARRDPLTGLPNRLAIMELLAEAQRARTLAGTKLAVFFIDLDNLKVVNDGLGHSAGDELLVAVARRLESGLRSHDMLGRFGGDEFVVICPDLADSTAAHAVAQRVLATARQMVQLPTTQVQLSASIGVAVDVDGQTCAEDLIRDADTAMYEAKRRGKNRASVFDTALRARVTDRLRLENDLRAALGTGELEVWFQPVLDTATFEIRGAEGLVRWVHPSHGIIVPDDFVPLAEETGLIIPLGYEVLATALAVAGQLERDFPEFDGLNVGVNVSGRQFADRHFADRILDIIAASAVPVEKVVLELTESVLLERLDHVDRSLHRLRDAGLQIALDDFGCGYSSLNYLRRYPVSVLKLDTSYTQQLTTEPDSRIIAEAITTMADRLGLMIVAEGIETKEHLDVVHELGITRAQGYLLGRPAPAEQLRPNNGGSRNGLSHQPAS